MRCLLFEMSCEFLNEVVDEYLTFHQTRMLPERKIPIPKRNSNMSEQMLLGNGNISQEFRIISNHVVGLFCHLEIKILHCLSVY